VADAGFHHAFVCTEGGLLVAGDGGALEDRLAGVVSLMDVVLQRADRDLAFHAVDEVTLLDREGGRLVVRPVASGEAARMFLVVSAPTDRTWRRASNGAVRTLAHLLADTVREPS
jgi:hypothetical protein